MEIRLDNKVAIVTGGRQGVGHAITERFLAEGASALFFASALAPSARRRSMVWSSLLAAASESALSWQDICVMSN